MTEIKFNNKRQIVFVNLMFKEVIAGYVIQDDACCCSGKANLYRFQTHGNTVNALLEIGRGAKVAAAPEVLAFRYALKYASHATLKSSKDAINCKDKPEQQLLAVINHDW